MELRKVDDRATVLFSLEDAVSLSTGEPVTASWPDKRTLTVRVLPLASAEPYAFSREKDSDTLDINLRVWPNITERMRLNALLGEFGVRSAQGSSQYVLGFDAATVQQLHNETRYRQR